LKTILTRERNEFLEYANNYYKSAIADDYDYMHDEVNKYTEVELPQSVTASNSSLTRKSFF
jgi:hypothetical protein